LRRAVLLGFEANVVASWLSVPEAGLSFVTFAGVGRLMSSFFRFWKGASKSTVRATEARKIEMNSLVSSWGEYKISLAKVLEEIYPI